MSIYLPNSQNEAVFLPTRLRVLVLGGTGFVGRHLCEKLIRAGHEVTVPTRKAASAKHIQHLPGLTVLEANVFDATQLSQLLTGHDAVVNLVAILHGNEQSFERTHVELPRLLVQACKSTGVLRVLHVSAIGVNEKEPEKTPSMYLRSKARGERVLLESDLDVSLLRPSVIFGADDKFTNLFASLSKLTPVLPLAGAKALFQPVWVEDVASALVKLLELPRAKRSSAVVEACGPEVLSLAEIVMRSALSVHRAPTIIGLPEWAALAQAALMELLPGQPLMSRDNVRSMRVANVADPAKLGLSSLGIAPAKLK